MDNGLLYHKQVKNVDFLCDTVEKRRNNRKKFQKLFDLYFLTHKIKCYALLSLIRLQSNMIFKNRNIFKMVYILIWTEV